MHSFHPWATIWGHPRNTVRSILSSNPKRGIIFLATLYLLQELFYLSNYWSLGLAYSYPVILITSLILAPFLGVIWIFFSGWIFYLIGRGFGGTAPMSHLRVAIAWSKAPMVLSLIMWFFLLVAHPRHTFIQNVNEAPSALFISFISLGLSIWSFFVLVQGVREVQDFSFPRACLNVILSLLVSFVIYFLAIFVFRILFV